jgi:hypothetical protein
MYHTCSTNPSTLSSVLLGAVYERRQAGSKAIAVEDLKSHIVPTFKEVVPQLVEMGITGKALIIRYLVLLSG